MALPPIPATIRDAVRRFAIEHDLLRPGRLVVAISGGTDSTALLLLLADLSDELGVVLHAAHFDHRTRRSGRRDAQLAADLAARAGATIRIGRAERAPKSEDDARRARYAFLRRVAAEQGATAIATGHTRDDQAETVLLHLTRGSGVAGLAGMRPSRDGIVRPLLCLARRDTAAVCEAAGIVPLEDPTNRSLRYARNRIRRRVLPELAAINPQVTAALARLADAAADVSASHRRRAEALLAGATGDRGIDLDALGGDAALREEALASAWERGAGHVLGAAQRRALTAEASRRDGTAMLDLPGGRALREYGFLRVVLRDASGAEARSSVTAEGHPGRPLDGPAEEVALAVGAMVGWDGWRIGLVASGPAPADAPLRASVPRERTAGLAVRARRPGDRMAGPVRLKVQDVLTDAKVPVRDRARMPLVVTADGDVAWIPGVAAAWNDPPDGPVLIAYPPRGASRAVVSLQDGRSGE